MVGVGGAPSLLSSVLDEPYNAIFAGSSTEFTADLLQIRDSNIKPSKNADPSKKSGRNSRATSSGQEGLIP